VNACLLVLGVLVGCGGGAPPADGALLPAAGEDRWLAEDKLRHFGMYFAATGFAYGGARFLVEPDVARLAAAAAALAAGVGKEIHDVRAGYGFSLKDLAWDAAGVALGLALVRNIR
jgi:uncharacterized protein YfiM (DUF2279 family)